MVCKKKLFLLYFFLKVPPDLRGCPPVSSAKKIRMRAILKENTADYVSLERLLNVDFGKQKMNCRFFKFHKRKLQK